MANNEFDVVVVGEGLAGATAAAAAVSEGARVALASKGPGSFVLADGCVELGTNNVANAAWLGTEADRGNAVNFFVASAGGAGCEYRGGFGERIAIPTILGTFRQVSLAPLYFGSRDLWTMGKVVVAGFEGSLDLDAKFLAERYTSRAKKNGKSTKFTARTLNLGQRRVQPSHELEFATHFDRDPQFRESVVMALATAAESADCLILPGVLGLNTSTDELREIVRQVGCAICEIATLPPSILGIRLLRRMERYLGGLGVELMTGFSVSKLLLEGDRCQGVELETPGRERRIEAQAVVVATGGFSHLLQPKAAPRETNPMPANEELLACAGGQVIAQNLFACGGALRTSNVFSENAVAILTGVRAGRLAAAVGVHHAGR